MDRSFLIAKNSFAISILILSILLITSLGLVFFLFFNIFCNHTNVLGISLPLFFIILFIYLIIKILYTSNKVIVNIQCQMLEIEGLIKNIFYKQYFFHDIKNINIYEDNEHVIDYGNNWQMVLEIIGKQNKTLYATRINHMINFEKFYELCSQYFTINICSGITG